MSDASFDFIIIGGGTAGCVLASRFLERQPSLSVLLIEAGPDVTHRPHVAKPLEAALLHGTDIDWNYLTTPQLHLDGKPRYNCGVKALSGGVVINSGNSLFHFPSVLPVQHGRIPLNTHFRWMDARRRAGLR